MSRNLWYRFLYLTISALAFYYLANRIMSFDEWDAVNAVSLNTSWLFLLAVQIVLWAANLGTETLKWNYLLSAFSNYSFFDSLKMVFAGFTAGSFTPMKLGEHGGRLIFLRKEDRAAGVMASVFGSYLNTMAILLLSLFVLPALLSKRLLNADFPDSLPAIYYYLLILIIIALSSLMIWLLSAAVKKSLRNTAWAVKKEFFYNLRFKRVLKLFSYTLFRVVIYNLQLFVWFRFFNISCTWEIFFLLSPLYFMAITMVPAMFLLDLGIRGSAGLFIFSFQCGSSSVILFALFLLWFINVAIPVLAGNVILIFNKHHKHRS